MKNLKAFILATTLIYGRSACADMANGTYTYNSSGTIPVWDISGDYSGDLGLGLGMDFTITEDSFGNFQGSGSFSFDDGSGDSLNGDISAMGKIKGSATVASVSMAMLITGTGTIVVDQFGDTDDVNFTAAANLKLTLDAANEQLVTTSGSVSVTETDLSTGKKRSRSVSLGKGAVLPLPFNSTGGWNLTLNLTPDGTKYTGTATVMTSTGGTMEFTATGTYSSKTDTSNITLKGQGGELTMVISTSGQNLTVNSMKGKVYGQTLNFKAP